MVFPPSQSNSWTTPQHSQVILGRSCHCRNPLGSAAPWVTGWLYKLADHSQEEQNAFLKPVLLASRAIKPAGAAQRSQAWLTRKQTYYQPHPPLHSLSNPLIPPRSDFSHRIQCTFLTPATSMGRSNALPYPQRQQLMDSCSPFVFYWCKNKK